MKRLLCWLSIAALAGVCVGCGSNKTDTSRPTAAPADAESTACRWATLGAAGEAARRYVRAVERNDADEIAASFTSRGTLLDSGERIVGTAAIRSWATNEVVGGRLTVLGCERRGPVADLLVRFAPGGDGGFRAHYMFTPSGDRIARLELTYA